MFIADYCLVDSFESKIYTSELCEVYLKISRLCKDSRCAVPTNNNQGLSLFIFFIFNYFCKQSVFFFN